MDIIRLKDTVNPVLPASVATIGFFDGVHRGHKFLIRQVRQEAQASGLSSMVITFDQHPRQVLAQAYQPHLLTTLDEKLRRLSMTDIDYVVVLHFDSDMASLSAFDFMRTVLRDRLHVRQLVIGYDNRFGHRSALAKSEGFDDYVRYGEQLGIRVVHNPAFLLNDVKVSSSVVRSFLSVGEVELANQCLGYPFMLPGHVVHGYQEGRRIGFPTANLSIDDDSLLIPENGVYAVRVTIGTDAVAHEGMMNIGTRPTFDGDKRTLEVNIFDFDADIYGQPVSVAFMKRLRAEKRFDSPARLAEQLRQDERDIRAFFVELQEKNN